MIGIKLIGNFLRGGADTFGIRGIINLMIARHKEVKQIPNKITKVHIKKLGAVIYIRSMTSDYRLLLDFFCFNNMYDIDFSSYDIEPINNIVDAGANIGLFTLLFANRFPSSNFYCIEPEENNFRFLKKNTASVRNVKYYHAGLWQRCCPLEVTKTPLSSGTVGYVVREVDGQRSGNNALKGIDIPALLERNHIDMIDILKMDIEGSEFPIFLSSSYECWIDKVKVLIIEVHDDYYENGTEIITKILESHGFDRMKVGEDLVFIKSVLRRQP